MGRLILPLLIATPIIPPMRWLGLTSMPITRTISMPIATITATTLRMSKPIILYMRIILDIPIILDTPTILDIPIIPASPIPISPPVPMVRP